MTVPKKCLACVAVALTVISVSVISSNSVQARSPFQLDQPLPEPIAPPALTAPIAPHSAPLHHTYQAPRAIQHPAVQQPAIQHYSTYAPKTCCPPHHIRYVDHKSAQRMFCSCCPPQHVVLQVPNPCDCGCPIDVPVCLPPCCNLPPKVDMRKGLFGAGIAIYDWCCDYKVKIIVKHNGDVIVHSIGR